ncbi:MAG: ABC transporter permease [Corynebacterium casei]|uniref:ABC transporter permease n=2 Tax=Corynebacterium casei TaxID=160386 RepID=A0ABN4CGH4_9CORY|nr:hypothetical protein [Corynebacterium casei]AHI21251.1 hypothetical protein CCASEI_13505 [Corynebacterium casei LMG S-19264]MDN5784488.1 ABC transporter permease [Corynebacterium casei]MDN5902148.1 ABC transporter permease [Corynebacterium casei]MDN5921796.1 ABC transporter permease [Corynebacterium casei]MDN6244935.1 ABC transporter permease [Corynebacterium casei]
MNARLMWELVEKPKWALRLFLFVMLSVAVSSGSNMYYFLFAVIGLLTLTGPEGDAFWLLGLSKREYNFQRRIEIGIGGVLFVLIAVLIAGLPWPFVAGYLVIAAVLIVKTFDIPQRQSVRKAGLVSQSSGRTEDGRFPPTIEGQLLIRPQVRAWGFIAILSAVTALIYWAVHAIWGNEWADTLSIAAVIGSVMLFMTFEDTLTTSLREYVVFGGTRESWAHHTIVINAVIPGLLIVVSLVVPGWGIVGSLGAVYLLLILALVSLGLTTSPSWKVTVPVAVGAIALEVYMIVGIAREIYLVPQMAAIAGYIVGGLLLPTMAKRARLESGGLAKWFGMASTTS